jgi:hypothetical protein
MNHSDVPPTFRERVIALNGEHKLCRKPDGTPAFRAYVHAALNIIHLVCSGCDTAWPLSVSDEGLHRDGC